MNIILLIIAIIVMHKWIFLFVSLNEEIIISIVGIILFGYHFQITGIFNSDNSSIYIIYDISCIEYC